jgi:MYXO-CTERM domain-containing protein
MSSPAPKSSSWAYWALPLLALAGLAWYLLAGERSGERTSRPVAIAPQATTTTLPAQGSVADGDLGRQITAVIDSLGAVLPGVKDQASLNEALPKLQRANAGGAAKTPGQMRLIGKTRFGRYVRDREPALNRR